MRNYKRAYWNQLISGLFILFASYAIGEVKTFPMEEFSVFDYDGHARYILLGGTASEQCSIEPDKDVTAYPKFTSEKPVYGKILFFSETLFPRIEYCFAMDESEGTDKGYDRFYFDGNRDFNLTNDSVVKKAEKPPTQNTDENTETYFEPLTFTFKGQSLTLIPMLRVLNPDYQRMNLIYPTARRSTIEIGSKKYEAVLAKMVLFGGYDQPFSHLILDGKTTGLDTLGLFQNVDDQLYQCSATPNGDTISVKPYSGDFGTLKVADPKKQFKKAEINMGWILAKDNMVDLNQCAKKDDILQIPVGDYMPIRISMSVDDVRVSFGADFSDNNKTKMSFPIKIKKDEAFEYSLDTQFKVRFESPEVGERITCGDEVKVSAAMIDKDTGALLGGMEDLTKPEGEPINLPDDTIYKRYKSIDPVVTVTNSAGKQVAEGTMPFG